MNFVVLNECPHFFQRKIHHFMQGSSAIPWIRSKMKHKSDDWPEFVCFVEA